MNTDLSFHHCSILIKPGTLEFVLELFSLMNSNISYREKDARWCLVEEKNKTVEIQIIEIDQESLPIENKKNSHVAFISSDPRKELEKLESFCKSKNKAFILGSWSDKEFYFDCPDIFINFTVEVMDKRITE